MSDSDLEPGEYKQQVARKNQSLTPPGVDHAKSKSRSRSKESEHSKRSGSPRGRSYSRSRSRSKDSGRSRSRSYGKRSRSKEHYRSPKRSSYSRRSRSYDKKSYHRRSYSRSRSRSRGSRSPMSGRKRHIGDRMNPPSGKCLGVFGLSLYTTESDLQDVFSRYGYIDKCNIVIDQKTGRSRGFGFVYFEESNDAVEAKDRANGMDLDGRKIRVDFSITKRAHTPTPGMYVGRPAPHHSSGPPRRYDDRGGGDRYQDRYDNRDRRGSGYDRRGGGGGGGGGRYDDRDRYSSRRSPSPYYSSHRRSPSPYARDRRY